MSTRIVDNQRPTKKPQGRVQRTNNRENPAFSGVAWGQPNWPTGTADTADDLTSAIWPPLRIAPFADLTALAADGTYGDGNLAYNSGNDFSADEFVYLEDGSQAHYDTDAWVEGVAPGA